VINGEIRCRNKRSASHDPHFVPRRRQLLRLILGMGCYHVTTFGKLLSGSVV